MAKPFDLEAAKQGKPFRRRAAPYMKNLDCRLVGVRLDGTIVIEYKDPKGSWYLDYFDENKLEMLPEKKEIEVMIVQRPNGEVVVWNKTESNMRGLKEDKYYTNYKLLQLSTVTYEV